MENLSVSSKINVGLGMVSEESVQQSLSSVNSDSFSSLSSLYTFQLMESTCWECVWRWQMSTSKISLTNLRNRKLWMIKDENNSAIYLQFMQWFLHQCPESSKPKQLQGCPEYDPSDFPCQLIVSAITRHGLREFAITGKFHDRTHTYTVAQWF